MNYFRSPCGIQTPSRPVSYTGQGSHSVIKKKKQIAPEQKRLPTKKTEMLICKKTYECKYMK